MSSPQIRIVIPAYRASKTIEQCLTAIQRSTTVREFEVVIVDGGRNGNLHSLEFDFPLSVVKAGKQNTGHSRNTGVGSFQGEIIIFIDADVQIYEDTIDQITDPIENGTADASIGSYSSDVDNLAFLGQYKQLYSSRIYSRRSGFVDDFFWTAIGAIKTTLFNELGGFDCDLKGNISEDVEFGQRLTKQNARIKRIPDARGIHLKEHSLSSLIKSDFRKGFSAFYLSLCDAKSVSNNPHVTKMDAIGAVYSVVLLFSILFILLSGISPLYSLISIAFLVSVYFLIRREFMSVYAKKGVVFLLKSISLMFFLDLLRIVCVFTATTKYLGMSIRTLYASDAV